MNETILQKENMDAVRALTKAQMDISDAKNLLFKLQEEETIYLEAREKKALAKIQKVLDGSKELISEIKQNHGDVHQLCRTVSDYSTFLTEAHERFQTMLEIFTKRNELWDENVKLQQKEFSQIKKEIKEEKEHIETERQGLKDKQKKLEEEKLLIESRQATLLASYEAEKALWNKLSPKN